MTHPHRIQPDDVRAVLDAHVLELASATTADRTQRKRLLRKGAVFIVDRRYLVERVPQVVYAGDDLEEAVRLYNQLS